MRTLHLHLKGEYFDAIKAGSKTEEFRLADKWYPTIMNNDFDQIKLYRGYPKGDDPDKTMLRRWNGYQLRKIQHPHFGDDPVDVVAIDVSKNLP